MLPPPIQHSLLDAQQLNKESSPKKRLQLEKIEDNPYLEESAILENFVEKHKDKYAISLLSSR